MYETIRFNKILPRSANIFRKFFNDMSELNLLNFNDAFQRFLNTQHNVINAHAPLKRCTRRQKRLQCKPWISKGLYVSIRTTQKLYKSHYLKGRLIKKNFIKDIQIC